MTRISSDELTDDAPAGDSDDPTRDRLVEAAARRFAVDDLDHVSLEQVAREAGLHRTTLHRHFPGGRDELVRAVFEYEVAAVTRRVMEVIQAAPDVRTAVADAVVAAVELGRASRVVAALLLVPATREHLLGHSAVMLRELATEAWGLVLAHRGDTDPIRAAAVPTDLVVDYLFRMVSTLVAEPGPVVGTADVRDFAEAFMVPALVG